jgi:hypothetical protein
MFKGQSQCLVTSSAQHRQEAEVATAEERERAAAETAATTAWVARLAMAELTTARAEVEAATADTAATATRVVRLVMAELTTARAEVEAIATRLCFCRRQ